jgi:3-hydroxyisobutyrate dehydrogenase-like beta-hydroxyacid dehydrogenase
MFQIELVKDRGYVNDEDSLEGAEVPVPTATPIVYGDAKTDGYGADNITGVMQLFI